MAIAGLAALALPGCSSQPSWAEDWKEIKKQATYAYYCDVALCDDIETGYEPECDCWCGYDGDGSDDGGGGDEGGGDEGGGDEGGGDDGDGSPPDDCTDCGEDTDGGDDDGSSSDDCTDDVGDCGEDSDEAEDADDADDGNGNCTLTQGYWKNHNEFQTNRNQAVDWPAPMDERDEICGRTLLDILNTRSHGEAWNILAHQYVAASLNSTGGADASGISAELDQARSLLVSNCSGIGAEDRATAIELAELLDAYNNGVIGPGHCHK